MTTIRVRNHYTVQADQDLQFTDEPAFLLTGGGKSNAPEIDDFGDVQVTSAADGVTLTAIDSDPAADHFTVRNENGAVLRAEVTGAKSDVIGMDLNGPATVENNGEITVSSLGGHAHAVMAGGGGMVHFENDGAIAALGHSEAVAVALQGDAEVVNGGQIIADATESQVKSATGVYVSGDATVVNSGSIEAHGVYNAQGIAIDRALGGLDNQGRIVVSTTHALQSDDGSAYALRFGASGNSGLIKCMLDGHPGDAIFENGYSGSTPPSLFIENTGKIIGSISLFIDGDDRVSNSGAINGDINLGGGNDHFVETGRGSVTGDVFGYTGDDVLVGGGAADRMYGDQAYYGLQGDGDDSLNGGGGDDTLVCGKGQDTLVGGKGGDLLTGGADADVFVYSKVEDSAGAHRDLITDLSSEDRIDLSAIDANTGARGDQAFTLVAALDGHAGDASLVYDPGKDVTFLNLDVDGDGKADAVIRIAGDHGDFTNFAL